LGLPSFIVCGNFIIWLFFFQYMAIKLIIKKWDQWIFDCQLVNIYWILVKFKQFCRISCWLYMYLCVLSYFSSVVTHHAECLIEVKSQSDCSQPMSFLYHHSASNTLTSFHIFSIYWDWERGLHTKLLEALTGWGLDIWHGILNSWVLFEH
jgi:hypothetical protein